MLIDDEIDRGLHPLMSGHPPVWANGWGRDRFGVFASITLGEGDLEVTQVFRWIPAGRFLMGSPEQEEGRFDSEGPQVEITFRTGYWLMDTPVTQAMWVAVMEENPSRWNDPKRPVEQVSWRDATEFNARLTDTMGEDGSNGFRLPSEAEWEYACRADTTEATYAGPMEILELNHAPVLDEIAWYGGNSGVDLDREDGFSVSWPGKQYEFSHAATRTVAQKKPNSWGLFDTLGNVLEWCEDDWRGSHEGASAEGLARQVSQQDAEEELKVVRGGSWVNVAGYVRAAYRYRHHPEDRYDNLGFRCARGQAGSAGGR